MRSRCCKNARLCKFGHIGQVESTIVGITEAMEEELELVGWLREKQ